MKNSTGFTIVELLAVLLILSIIMTITIPKISSASLIVKDKIVESKINTIAIAAEKYGNRNINNYYMCDKDSIAANKNKCVYKIEDIIQELINKRYLEGEKEELQRNPKNNEKISKYLIFCYNSIEYNIKIYINDDGNTSICR